MNMNKVLAAGLIAAVASTASLAECGNGGFYVGLNAGMSFTKAKVKAEKVTYTESATTHYGSTDWTVEGEQNNQKKISKAHADKRSEILTPCIKKSNKKTNFAAELVLGYDFRINDVMMGVDLTFGSNFGKVALKAKGTISKQEATDADLGNEGGSVNRTYGKVKEQWHVGLMPRVGYLFTPEFEGYVTFGVKFAKLKTQVPNLITGYDVTTATTAKLSDDYSIKKKSGMRVIPVVGAGVRYEFTPELFAKLEYNFDFRAKAKMHKDAMEELKSVKVSAHVVKLGLGYRF